MEKAIDISQVLMLVINRRLPNTACMGVCARPTGSQAVWVAWSWFRYSGVLSSRRIEPVKISSTPKGNTHRALRRGAAQTQALRRL
jgi:hypothetical protein